MISQNIKVARMKAGLSQEELAQRLHVVRQTVSKWERDLSVPDAQMLIELAEVLGVTVSDLLGQQAQGEDGQDLAEKLALVNAELAQQQQENRRQKSYLRKRDLILFLAFFALFIALGVHNEILATIGIFVCALGGVFVLYRNLSLMTNTEQESELKTFRQTSMFVITLLVLIATGIILVETGRVELTDEQENIFAWLVIVVLMIFAGWSSPKLAWNRHIGLRLPWTVGDLETWNLAHRILGWISLPAAVLYSAAVLVFSDFGLTSAVCVVLWIAVPSLASLVFWWRKYRRH